MFTQSEESANSEIFLSDGVFSSAADIPHTTVIADVLTFTMLHCYNMRSLQDGDGGYCK